MRHFEGDLGNALGETGISHAFFHDRDPKFSFSDQRRIYAKSTHNVPYCKQLLNNEDLVQVRIGKILKDLMTVKNLAVLSKKVKDKRHGVSPFESNNFCHPVSKVRDQAVEENAICHVEEPRVNVKKEAVATNVQEVEECSIYFEDFPFSE